MGLVLSLLVLVVQDPVKAREEAGTNTTHGLTPTLMGWDVPSRDGGEGGEG